jgi:hypothetical protein
MRVCVCVYVYIYIIYIYIYINVTCQASRSSSTSGADNYRRTSRSRSRVDPASEPAEAAVPAADAGAGDTRRPAEPAGPPPGAPPPPPAREAKTRTRGGYRHGGNPEDRAPCEFCYRKISKSQAGQSQHRASKFCLWHRLCQMGYSSRDAENLAKSIADIYTETGDLKIPGPPGHFDSPESQTVLRSCSEKERRKTSGRAEAARDSSRSHGRRRARERSRRRDSPRRRSRGGRICAQRQEPISRRRETQTIGFWQSSELRQGHASAKDPRT